MKNTLSLKVRYFCLLGTIALLAFSSQVFAQKTIINIDFSPVAISPNDPFSGNFFPLGGGLGLNALLNRNLKQDFAVSGGLTLNKLWMRKNSGDFLFGTDILNNTHTEYLRKLNINEIGVIGMVEKKISLKKFVVIPTLGTGATWLFSTDEVVKTQGTGPDMVGNSYKYDWNFSVNFHLGMSWQWPLPYERQIGFRPVFTYRLGKIRSDNPIVTSPFQPHTIALQIFFKNLFGKQDDDTPSKT